MSLPAAANASGYILWLQPTSLIGGLQDLCCIMNFCSLSLSSCALFSFDWDMNSRKWITSHHLNSKHPLLNILIAGKITGSMRLWFFLSETSVLCHGSKLPLSWRIDRTTAKSVVFTSFICPTLVTSFYFQEAWAHITSYHSGRSENCKWRVCFPNSSYSLFFPSVFWLRDPLKRKIPSKSLLVEHSFPEVL